MKKFLFVLVLSVCSLCAKSQSFSDGFKNQYIRIGVGAYLPDITHYEYDRNAGCDIKVYDEYYSLSLSYNFYSSKTIDFESGAAYRFSLHECSRLLYGPMFVNTLRYKPFEICCGIRPYIQASVGIAYIYKKYSEEFNMDFTAKIGFTGKVFKDKLDVGAGIGLIGQNEYLVASVAYYINLHRKK